MNSRIIFRTYVFEHVASLEISTEDTTRLQYPATDDGMLEAVSLRMVEDPFQHSMPSHEISPASCFNQDYASAAVWYARFENERSGQRIPTQTTRRRLHDTLSSFINFISFIFLWKKCHSGIQHSWPDVCILVSIRYRINLKWNENNQA